MWWASLLGGLVSIAGSMAGRVLLSLGFGFVSYTGISTALSALQTTVQNTLLANSANVIIVLGLLKVDVCISILFSALAARMVLQGLTSGTIKRMVVK